MSPYKASSSSSFLNSIGINASIGDLDVASKLSYLGINHFRTDWTGTDTASDILQMGSQGAKADLIFPWFLYAIGSNQIKMFVHQIELGKASIEAVEGPNELNTDPDTYKGLGGPAGFEALQTDLYTAVHSNPLLKNVSVYDFSVLQGTPQSTYTGMQNSADFNNVHAYGGAGIPPVWIFPYEISHNTIAGNKPTVITETGATTIPSDNGVGVNQIDQARFDLVTLLDSYALGSKITYLYNLKDWNDTANIDNFSAYYGVYDKNGAPKIAAVALHNFTSLFSDTAQSSGASSFDMNVTGLMYNDQTSVFVSAGKTNIVVWNESQNWSTAAHNVEITLPSAYHINVFDPILGKDAILTSTGSNVSFSLGNDPLIIQLTAVQSAPVWHPTAQDSIALTDLAGNHSLISTLASGTAVDNSLNKAVIQTVTNGLDVISTPDWNNVRTLNLHNTTGNSYVLNNFMESDASLSGGVNALLNINGAKRGVINLDHGDYSVTINARSNAADPQTNGVQQHLNDFVITAASGNDNVTVNGVRDITKVVFQSGSGHDVLHVTNAQSTVTFGSGRAEVTGDGHSANSYTYHASSGIDIIQNLGTHDQLNIDHSLSGQMHMSTGNEGTTLMFGSAQHEIVLHAIQNFDSTTIHWI